MTAIDDLLAQARQIADAVLYEGYLLWPYRRSATKNQRRWTFGGVYPPGTIVVKEGVRLAARGKQGRGNGGGGEVAEMPRNRDNSFCCGAGGGRIWLADEPGQERPSENRIREAVALGELDHFVVACPKDVVMYEDAIKTSGHEERISLREISELLEAAALTRGTSAPMTAGR